ncbi:MAG: sphingolipid delta-4 desaturase, partial [Gammaproteobacteria bacterium]
MSDFTYLDGHPVHFHRGREILKAHPEIKQLMGKNPWTALWVAGIVAAQWAVASQIGSVSWYWLIF